MTDKIQKLKTNYISKRTRKIMDDCALWESRGFSNEVAAAASSICLELDALKRRIQKLEKVGKR